MQVWKEKVHDINPLDEEFSKRRIKISDLVDPAQNAIISKVFIGCDLIGPATIAFVNGGSLSHVSFLNCDIIPIKEGVNIQNAIAVVNITMTRGRLIDVTVLAPPQMLNHFRAMNAPFLSYTKDEVLNSQ